ncbi:MAG: hypothetical protein KGZ91_00165 [Afipia sp.]|nr:hypothetical protein [Afipia sp.]
MFDIINSRDFYQKLLEEFDDYMANQASARHAMNCAITAHHLAEWVWGDFLKGDEVLKAKLGIRSRDDFLHWIDNQSVWYGVVQNISNGSKHFIRASAEGTVKVQGWGMGGYGQGPFGQSYLAIKVSEIEPQNLPVSQLLEVVIRFWRDFFSAHSPYSSDMPVGKTTLSTP